MKKIMDAYSMVLEQLSTGQIDDNFFQCINMVYQFAQQTDGETRKQMAKEFHEILSHQQNVGIALSMYSFVLRLDANVLYLEIVLKILRALQAECGLKWQNAYFYYVQWNRFRLKHESCDTEDVRKLLSELIRHGVISCMRQLNVAMRPMIYGERDNNHVVVLTEEFLLDGSKQTEQILNCCYQLQCMSGKRVLLVNTAEAASKAGEMSFFGVEYGREDKNLCQRETVEWKGEQIAYFQCREVLSDLTKIEETVIKILKYNPGMVFHIGDNSIMAGIINEWIPVMAVGRTFGRFVVSSTEFQASFESEEELASEFLSIAADYEETIQNEGNLKARLVFPADYFKEENRRVSYYKYGDWNSCIITEGRKKAWAAELGILAEIERICKKYGIAYYAYKGTLLGAVRHQGFIPWDDDIDIVMKREDYQKFAAAAPKEFGDRYRLIDAAIVPQWEQFKIQVVCASDAGKLLYEERRNRGCLPCVDIAVLDYFPSDQAEAEQKKKFLEEIFTFAYKMDKEISLHKDTLKEFQKIRQNFKGELDETRSIRNQLIWIQQQTASQNVSKSSTELFQSTDYYKNRKWVTFPDEWWNGNETVPFENQRIPVPHNYEKVLDLFCGYEDWRNKPCRFFMKDEEFAKVNEESYDKQGLLEYKSNFFEEEEIKIDYFGHARMESFYIEAMMKRAWAASLKILKEIERICKKYNILYFADWGTMLGAVRHQGFVPWDDDLDIVMKREDYNRFIVLAKENLLEGFCLVDAVHDEKWEQGIMRVLNVLDLDHARIEPYTEKTEEFFGCPYIVGVDIYAMDYLPRDKDEEDLQTAILVLASKVSSGLKGSNGQITEEIQGYIKKLEEISGYHFTDENSIMHQTLRLESAICQLYGKEDGDVLTEMYSHVACKTYGGEYRLRKEWYEKSVPLPFETTTVEVSSHYMDTLVCAFGRDWDIGYCGGSSHEYPFYREQQRRLENLGIIVE